MRYRSGNAMSQAPNWVEYYKNTKGSPPSALLLRALPFVHAKKTALDLGGGNLKDTPTLLQEGFQITVVDQEPLMRSLAENFPADSFKTIVSSFADFAFPIESFDLVTANYALPFNPPETFDRMFRDLKASVKKEGIFCGQFFGVRDEWSSNPQRTFHTKEQVEALFSEWEILFFQEEEKDGKIADGTPKHWHVFHIIAKK